jgi:hypothetical protein
MFKKLLLFVIPAALGGGLASLLWGTSEPWAEGGKIVSVSYVGRWLLFLGGGLAASIGSCMIFAVAHGLGFKYAVRASHSTLIAAGLVIGSLVGCSSCFCISLIFFTFPFPGLYELMTDRR